MMPTVSIDITNPPTTPPIIAPVDDFLERLGSTASLVGAAPEVEFVDEGVVLESVRV
jgi:hypothetical protein